MRKIFLTIWLLIVFQTAVFCQNQPGVLENAIAKIRNTITDHIIERAYLHFDRPYLYYVAGETVYFKAYVTMGERHEPSRISGILHVDLIDKRDRLLQTENIQLVNGIGWGDFTLPDTLQKGSYRVRAYTQWMRNGDPAYFFDKYISVSSINSADRVTGVKQGGEPTIDFFPEGGNLVAGNQSKVAFKAAGTDGLGVNVQGIIIDNNGDEVTKIVSTHLGMGVFELTPGQGKSYKAKINFGNGPQRMVDLPQVEAEGVTLAVNNSDPSKIAIEIKASRSWYQKNLNKELSLLIYSDGAVRSVKTRLESPVLGLELPAGSFKTGILQITLFSQTGEPLNERLAFIQNADLLKLSLNTDKQVYGKRVNVKMNLNAKNNDGAAGGSFSVSVVDESKVLVDENAESTILTNLLLTSDLKGYVEKPNYYFANISPQTRADLDMLLLTQGYRRFVWKQLLNDSVAAATPAYKPEQLIDITGNLKTRAGVAIANTEVSLLPSGGGAIKVEKTDSKGNFRFSNLLFNTGDRFIIKTRSSSRKNAAVVRLDSPAAGALLSPGNPAEAKYDPNADILTSLQNTQAAGPVTAGNEARIYVKDDRVTRVKRNDDYRSSNIGGPGHADQVINGEVFKYAPTLSSGLNGVARNVTFVKGVPFQTAGATVVTNNTVVVEPMLVVVDGMITQGGSIDVFNPVDVETVEILRGTNSTIYGVAAGVGGVMVITTRQGGAAPGVISKEMAPGIYSFTPNGFYKAREFYSPQYDASSSAAKAPDTRTTIFWKPDVITDTNGNASFNFFNADGTGTYRVVIEGIDSEGNLGRLVYKYKVE